MARRLHPGRPGTRAVPTDWAAAHRPTVAGTRNGTAALRKPGTTQTWSNERDEMVSTPHPAYWTGSARFQALGTQARVVTTAEDTETVASYLVAIAAAATATDGDLVDVTASGDPLLDGRTLRVVQVLTGTERFERDLLCNLTD